LTLERPKPLCPVAGRPLVDLALERLRRVCDDVAVNLHHGAEALDDHLAPTVHRSLEAEGPLGTAGALGRLRPWIDGRPVVVVNADAWCPGDLSALVEGWDGESTRLLVPGGGPLRPDSAIAGALMSWSATEPLEPAPSGLYEVAWQPAAASGLLETVAHAGPFIDCGTAADYLRANLAAAGGSAIDPTARVEGTVTRSVVWDGAQVGPGERLVDAVRTSSGRTVLVRPGGSTATDS
jgi:NDP-sugar pyrophosphorylase family protein